MGENVGDWVATSQRLRGKGRQVVYLVGLRAWAGRGRIADGSHQSPAQRIYLRQGVSMQPAVSPVRGLGGGGAWGGALRRGADGGANRRVPSCKSDWAARTAEGARGGQGFANQGGWGRRRLWMVGGGWCRAPRCFGPLARAGLDEETQMGKWKRVGG
jgi:hypothetical protein